MGSGRQSAAHGPDRANGEAAAPQQRDHRVGTTAAAALLLHDRVGSIFDAIVTGVNKDGTYVRLLSPPAEGRVLRGEKGMDVGERVRVRLLSTDERRGFIDFERA